MHIVLSLPSGAETERRNSSWCWNHIVIGSCGLWVPERKQKIHFGRVWHIDTSHHWRVAPVVLWLCFPKSKTGNAWWSGHEKGCFYSQCQHKQWLVPVRVRWLSREVLPSSSIAVVCIPGGFGCKRGMIGFARKGLQVTGVLAVASRDEVKQALQKWLDIWAWRGQ